MEEDDDDQSISANNTLCRESFWYRSCFCIYITYCNFLVDKFIIFYSKIGLRKNGNTVYCNNTVETTLLIIKKKETGH